jgi:hypothetical protein
MYEIGTIKLTWINPKDVTLLESKMYKKEDLQKALDDAKSKPDFMIFTLVKTGRKDEFQWKLMPYGEADRFVRSMQLSKNPIIPYLGIVVAGLALYGAYKLVNR